MVLSMTHLYKIQDICNALNYPEVLSSRMVQNKLWISEQRRWASESIFQSVRHNQDTYKQTEMSEIFEICVQRSRWKIRDLASVINWCRATPQYFSHNYVTMTAILHDSQVFEWYLIMRSQILHFCPPECIFETFLPFLFACKSPGCALLTEMLILRLIFLAHWFKACFAPFLDWEPQGNWVHFKYLVFCVDTYNIEWATVRLKMENPCCVSQKGSLATCLQIAVKSTGLPKLAANKI